MLCGVLAMAVTAGAWAQEDKAAEKAPEKIDLKINYEPGSYVVTKNVTMNVERGGEQAAKSQIQSQMIMDMVVGKPDASGNRELDVTYREVRFERKDGEQTEKFDSAEGKHSELPMGKMFEGMVGKKITVTVDPHGKVSQIKGVDEMVAAMLKNAGVEADRAAAIKESFGDRMVKETFAQMFAMPGKPVGKGDTWESTDKDVVLPLVGATQFKQTATLKDIKDGVATIAITGTLHSAGAETPAGGPAVKVNSLDVSGTMTMDIATGMVKHADVTQKGDLTLTTGEGEAKKEHKITLNGRTITTVEKK